MTTQNNIILFDQSISSKLDEPKKIPVFFIGEPAERTRLGLTYIHDNSSQEDYDTARYHFKKAASEGHAHAKHCLGVMYEQGDGVEKDLGIAAEWFLQSAEEGNFHAQNKVGHLYLNGDGVTQNNLEAVNWFKLAAGHGDINAQYCLGCMFRDGRGVRKDNILAYMWWNLAAEQRNEYAFNNREVIADEMTKEEIDEAKRLSDEWTFERP